MNALVTGTFSRRMMLEMENGVDAIGRLKGKKIQPVCGDLVVAEPIHNEPEWLIRDILPRKNSLTRPDSRGKTEVLAANLDVIVVMVSIEPAPDWYVVDRYLAAAENMTASAIVAFNKSDLTDSAARYETVLADYKQCNYPVVHCSSINHTGLATLSSLLKEKTSIIVGQSGVGKSSVLNALVDEAQQRTRTVSASTGEGRHTTVNSVMLKLPNGAAVIDSPGVRDYAPAIENADEVIRGFREIDSAGQQCRFSNCHHLREPDCAVKKAIANGLISDRRYESFKRLMTLSRSLAEKRG